MTSTEPETMNSMPVQSCLLNIALPLVQPVRLRCSPTYDAEMKLQTVLSSVLMGLGGGLTVLKIAEDSEPGAIPLLLLVSGIAWRVVERIRMRRREMLGGMRRDSRSGQGNSKD